MPGKFRRLLLGSCGRDVAFDRSEQHHRCAALHCPQWVEDTVPLYELYSSWQRHHLQRQQLLAAAAEQQRQHEQLQQQEAAAAATASLAPVRPSSRRAGGVLAVARPAGSRGRALVPAAGGSDVQQALGAKQKQQHHQPQHQPQQARPMDLFYAKLKVRPNVCGLAGTTFYVEVGDVTMAIIVLRRAGGWHSDVCPSGFLAAGQAAPGVGNHAANRCVWWAGCAAVPESLRHMAAPCCPFAPPPCRLLLAAAVDRQLLARELWLGSTGAVDWWRRQLSYAHSAATMSMVSRALLPLRVGCGPVAGSGRVSSYISQFSRVRVQVQGGKAGRLVGRE